MDQFAEVSTVPVAWSTLDDGLVIARKAFQDDDVEAAIHLWIRLITEFPGHPNGYDEAVRHLQAAGRSVAADRFLHLASGRFGSVPQQLLEYAHNPHQEKNYSEAIRRYAFARQVIPSHPDMFSGAALSMSDAGRLDDAEALLNEGRIAFPTNLAIALYHAWTAFKRVDFPVALERFEAFGKTFPLHHDGFTGAAETYRAMGRFEDAETILYEATQQFPASSTVLIEHARLAVDTHRWDLAATRLATLRRSFPKEPWGYVATAVMLRDQRKGLEADVLLAAGMIEIPESPEIRLQHAMLVINQLDRDRLDWAEGAKRMEALHSQFPHFTSGFIEYSKACCILGHFDAAEIAMTRAMEKLSNDPVIVSNWATVAQQRLDWNTAQKRFLRIVSEFPDHLDGYIGLGKALSYLDRFDEAEDLFESAMLRFSHDVVPFIEYAALAFQRCQFLEAIQRLETAQRRFPSDNRVATALNIYRSYTDDVESVSEEPASDLTVLAPVPVSIGAIENALDGGLIRDLLMQFESLGGGGVEGCEFGILQRHFGAEPLGLLRWSTMEPDKLAAAIQQRFEGVGLTENTNLGYEASPQSEYYTSDTRFGMNMHTFVHRYQMEPDKMLLLTCRRLQFLRRKMIDDLSNAQKLFVYRISNRNLTFNELDRIAVALRSYGKPMLFYVSYADSDHSGGEVRLARPGIIRGYVDRFRPSIDGRFDTPITEVWVDICRKADRIWKKQLVVDQEATGIAEANVLSTGS